MKNGIISFNTAKVRILKRIISCILVIAMIFTGINMDIFVKEVIAESEYITLYLKDDTTEHWIGNDNATIELAENTSGHDRYVMTKVNDTTWSARVPKSAYNITFNRYDSDKTIQWNSWSAGGKDGNNAYCVFGYKTIYFMEE